MTVFKSYIKVMKKNFTGILLYMVIFIGISVMITLSLSNSEPGNYVETNKTIAVINESQSSEAKNLENYLRKSFDVTEIKTDEKSIKENIFTQYVAYVLKINKDDSMEYYVNKDEGVSFIVNGKIEEYLNTNDILKKYKIKDADEITDKILDKNVKISYSKDESSLKAESLYYYYNSQSFVVMSILMIGVFLGYSKYKQANVKARMAVSATPDRTIERKIVMCSMAFIGFVWSVFLITAVILFDKDVLFGPVGVKYIISSLVYLLPVYGLSYFVATLSKDSNTNMAMVNFIVLPLSFISGVFVPLEFLPKFIEKIAIISPMYWNNKLYSSIFSGNFGDQNTIVYIGIQILFFLTFTLLGYLSSKRKLRSA